MKFMSKKDLVCNGRKIYRNRTVVEFDHDVSRTEPNWYRVDDESTPAKVERSEQTVVRPRISRIKK